MNSIYCIILYIRLVQNIRLVKNSSACSPIKMLVAFTIGNIVPIRIPIGHLFHIGNPVNIPIGFFFL